ncbi:uncharacterized protein LOC123948781 [Meles meles]|uniref:uncharacterized protein LOC123948781 n=1 Tax=Meles meles TaxID=9662 RepID=UPI001E69905B|nr:uncharacterized protein LOC123948781 [Meles meles]
MRLPALTKPAPDLFLHKSTEAVAQRENNNSPRCLGLGRRRCRRRRPTPRPTSRATGPPLPAPDNLSRWGVKPEPESALAVLVQQYELGSDRVLCGDCRKDYNTQQLRALPFLKGKRYACRLFPMDTPCPCFAAQCGCGINLNQDWCSKGTIVIHLILYSLRIVFYLFNHLVSLMVKRCLLTSVSSQACKEFGSCHCTLTPTMPQKGDLYGVPPQASFSSASSLIGQWGTLAGLSERGFLQEVTSVHATGAGALWLPASFTGEMRCRTSHCGRFPSLWRNSRPAYIVTLLALLERVVEH